MNNAPDDDVGRFDDLNEDISPDDREFILRELADERRAILIGLDNSKIFDANAKVGDEIKTSGIYTIAGETASFPVTVTQVDKTVVRLDFSEKPDSLRLKALLAGSFDGPQFEPISRVIHLPGITGPTIPVKAWTEEKRMDRSSRLVGQTRLAAQGRGDTEPDLSFDAEKLLFVVKNLQASR